MKDGCDSGHDNVVLNRARFPLWRGEISEVSLQKLCIADVCRKLTAEVNIIDAGRSMGHEDPFADYKCPPESSASLSLNHRLAQIGLIGAEVELLSDANRHSHKIRVPMGFANGGSNIAEDHDSVHNIDVGLLETG
jgi:hypothetical protein